MIGRSLLVEVIRPHIPVVEPPPTIEPLLTRTNVIAKEMRFPLKSTGKIRGGKGGLRERLAVNRGVTHVIPRTHTGRSVNTRNLFLTETEISRVSLHDPSIRRSPRMPSVLKHQSE